MADNVSPEALERVAKALGTYEESLREITGKMKQAAKDCNDNLGNDALSAQAISQLEFSVQKLYAAAVEAAELRSKISKKASDISDLRL